MLDARHLILGPVIPATEYRYQEYPKWVTGADGVRLVVNNANEEVEFLRMSLAGAKEPDQDMRPETPLPHLQLNGGKRARK